MMTRRFSLTSKRAACAATINHRKIRTFQAHNSNSLHPNSTLKAMPSTAKLAAVAALTALFTKDEWERIKHPQPGSNGLSNTSPWEHVHHIDRSCRQFKLKHLHAKVKALNAKKRLIEAGGESSADASAYEEEKARAIIMDMNYKFCQNQVSCPERMNRLATCWSAFGPVVIKKFTEAGQEGLICKSEREAVERCSGGLVQRLMRSATDDI